jgi:rhodanese-related sulfurtransferase
MSDLYISPQELHQQRDTPKSPTVIDVRSDEEYAAGHLPGAIHMPGDTLAQRLDEIPHDRLVVPY